MKRILIALGLASIAATAFAADAIAFKVADKNTDGKVTWEEVHVALPSVTEAQFKAADKDTSGALDDAEYATLPGAAM